MKLKQRIRFTGCRRKADLPGQGNTGVYSTTKKEDYNRKFFPITKVYLGNKMDAKKRKEIIDLCHKKNIPYVGVTRNPNYYEMEECQVLCENCDRYKSQDADGGESK